MIITANRKSPIGGWAYGTPKIRIGIIIIGIMIKIIKKIKKIFIPK